MSRRVLLPFLLAVTLLAAGAGAPSQGQTPKRGGILTSLIIEDPPGLNIHEAATTSTLWPMVSCYSNLVIFDQLKPRETVDSIVGDLAERWSWQNNYRHLVFFLRKGVKWHDGQPFTARDVKYTFDVVREAADALRQAQRIDWLLQSAVEIAYQQPLIEWLSRPSPVTAPTPVSVQAVFCIDVRSEPMRRALEDAARTAATSLSGDGGAVQSAC